MPDDIKNVIMPALSHRMILKAEARIRGLQSEKIIDDIVKSIPVPTVK